MLLKYSWLSYLIPIIWSFLVLCFVFIFVTTAKTRRRKEGREGHREAELVKKKKKSLTGPGDDGWG